MIDIYNSGIDSPRINKELKKLLMLLLNGKFVSRIGELMESALCSPLQFAKVTGLAVNPSQTELNYIFTRDFAYFQYYARTFKRCKISLRCFRLVLLYELENFLKKMSETVNFSLHVNYKLYINP